MSNILQPEILAASEAFNYPVLSVNETVALEKQLEAKGIPLLDLMTCAGKSVAYVASRTETVQDARIVILAGSGNNGGDGWVVAQELSDHGFDVTLITKTPAASIKAEPARSAALQAEHEGCFEIEVDPDGHNLECLINEADLIVDAILGTGFSHDEVKAPYDKWIYFANVAKKNSGTPIVSVDCPSGMNAQTGARATSCITADITVTMLALKPGLLMKANADHVGTLLLAPLVPLSER